MGRYGWRRLRTLPRVTSPVLDILVLFWVRESHDSRRPAHHERFASLGYPRELRLAEHRCGYLYPKRFIRAVDGTQDEVVGSVRDSLYLAGCQSWKKRQRPRDLPYFTWSLPGRPRPKNSLWGPQAWRLLDAD